MSDGVCMNCNCNECYCDEEPELVKGLALEIAKMTKEEVTTAQVAPVPCEHKNSYVRREGMTGTIGTVICPDCGYEREWNAY